MIKGLCISPWSGRGCFNLEASHVSTWNLLELELKSVILNFKIQVSVGIAKHSTTQDGMD